MLNASRIYSPAALMIGVQRAISLFTSAASGCCPRFALPGMLPPISTRRPRTLQAPARRSTHAAGRGAWPARRSIKSFVYNAELKRADDLVVQRPFAGKNHAD